MRYSCEDASFNVKGLWANDEAIPFTEPQQCAVRFVSDLYIEVKKKMEQIV